MNSSVISIRAVCEGFEPKGFTAISRGLSEERATPPDFTSKRSDPGRDRSTFLLRHPTQKTKDLHDT